MPTANTRVKIVSYENLTSLRFIRLTNWTINTLRILYEIMTSDRLLIVMSQLGYTFMFNIQLLIFYLYNINKLIDPFAILHAPPKVSSNTTTPSPRSESPSPALPPKKSKQPPPRPAPPRPAPPSLHQSGFDADFADFSGFSKVFLMLYNLIFFICLLNTLYYECRKYCRT